MYSKETKQKAVARMLRAEAIKEQMRPISPQALSKQYRTCWKTLAKLERGEDVNLPEQDKRDILDALKRYRALEAQHETRQEIAADLGVQYNNSNMYFWLKEARTPEPETVEHAGPVARFLLAPAVMDRPQGRQGYY